MYEWVVEGPVSCLGRVEMAISIRNGGEKDFHP